MPAELLFTDLFAYGDGSLGWLRVYRRDSQTAVALVLNPTDNPGSSAVNAAEQLLADLARSFPNLGELRVFVRFPDDPRGNGWTEVLDDADAVAFERRTVEDVEALLGASLLEPHLADASCAGLGGEHHPLLALIPPPEEDVDRLDRMAVVAVADLPWAHNPGSCHWKPRFEKLEALYPPSRHHRPALGAHWYLTLTESDFAACRYHECDWKRVAAVAVEVFKSVAEGAEIDDVFGAITDALRESVEGGWCASLFADPIVWNPGEASVINGQHRTCALKASGAPFCVANVAGAFVPEPLAGDPRRRAAAEVASFWARYAALPAP
jgi:hypothetical protein